VGFVSAMYANGEELILAGSLYGGPPECPVHNVVRCVAISVSLSALLLLSLSLSPPIRTLIHMNCLCHCLWY